MTTFVDYHNQVTSIFKELFDEIKNVIPWEENSDLFERFNSIYEAQDLDENCIAGANDYLDLSNRQYKERRTLVTGRPPSNQLF
jgi:hypothetical protein